MDNLPLTLGGLKICSADLKKYSTVGVGCVAAAVFPKSGRDLVCVLKDAADKNIPVTVIGNGSNVVFSDKAVGGVIVFTKDVNKITRFDGKVRAYSGVSLQKLVNFYADNGLGGMERLAGIPARVGGAIIMNAGAFGRNISESILKVGVIVNNKIVTLSASDCNFRYRGSALPNGAVVLYADFSYTKNSFAKAETADFLRRRIQKQPQGKSFGSAFKNPADNFAGALIDGANLKGYRVGGAKISEKHANFIINDNNATAADVKTLIEYVKNKVYGLYGIKLEEEVRFIGEF